MGNDVFWEKPLTGSGWTHSNLYRCATETGAYQLLVTLDITDTVYTDEEGISTDWYMYSYYDEGTDVESEKSDPFQATIFYCSIGDVEACTGAIYTDATTPSTLDVMMWIATATEFINEYSGRKFSSNSSTEEKHSGDGTPYIMLTNYPIQAISELIVDSATLTLGTDFWIADANAGVIECLNAPIQKIEGEAAGHENISVTYTWGTNSVPGQIRDFAACIVAMKALSAASMTSTSGGAVKSYTDGDVSLTYNDGDTIASALIANYERLKALVPQKISVAVGGEN
jgi:hypothetical protein